MTEVSGKTALITGGAMGMGRLLAETLAKEGANLVIWDRNQAKLAEAEEDLTKLGAKVWTYEIDITDQNKVTATAAQVAKDAGQVDVLVNNAGIVRGGHFLDVPIADHVKTMEVNILSYFYVTAAFLPAMYQRNQGHIVNMASAAGLTGVPGVSSYCASKFAVVGWTETLRMESKKLGKRGVHFTTVCPSFVGTGMFEGIKPPFLTPLLTTEQMVRQIHRAIKVNQPVLMAPLMVKFVPAMRGLNRVAVYDWFGSLLGMSESMNTWKGHPDVS